jgi:hypothetical protein
MKMKQFLLSVCIFGALAVWAQVPTSPEDATYSATTKWIPNTLTFSLDGQSYLARIEREAVLAGPTWDTSKPLPLSFARAERVARAELRKFVSDEPAWRARSFELIHLPNTGSWYYSVGLVPSAKREKKTTGFHTFVDSNGKAGNIEPGSLE